MLRTAAVSVLWIFVAAAPAVAQIAAPGPPGPYVIDVHGVSGSLPVAPSFLPIVPSGTSVPSSGLGVGVGAHVYLFRLGPGRVGLGASVARVRGGASTSAPSSGSGSPSTVPIRPDVEAAVTVVAPQVSFNFGSAAGWSYLSAGMGRARVTAVTSAFAGTGTGLTSGAEATSGMLGSLNIGAGARWFVTQRLGVSFDVRAHLLSARSAGPTRPATPRTSVMAVSAGMSVR